MERETAGYKKVNGGKLAPASIARSEDWEYSSKEDAMVGTETKMIIGNKGEVLLYQKSLGTKEAEKSQTDLYAEANLDPFQKMNGSVADKIIAAAKSNMSGNPKTLFVDARDIIAGGFAKKADLKGFDTVMLIQDRGSKKILAYLGDAV